MMIGNWHAEQPKQYSTPHERLLFCFRSIVAPSKRASIRYVPAKHTAALDYFSNIGMSEVLLTAPATLLPDFLIACPASPGLQGAIDHRQLTLGARFRSPLAVLHPLLLTHDRIIVDLMCARTQSRDDAASPRAHRDWIRVQNKNAQRSARWPRKVCLSRHRGRRL